MPSSIEVYLTATATGAPSLLSLVTAADPIVQLDLLLLVVMSIACWAIIIQKGLRLQAATTSSAQFLDAFWKAKRLDQIYEAAPTWAASPVSAVFQAGYKELSRLKAAQPATPGQPAPDHGANVERALRRAAQVESTQLRRFITVLATTGSTAPFIGLFGTVWGILQAFLKLGQPGTTATIQVVGPDIAHALVATAVGLVAAIPAVMAYNTYNAWVVTLDTEMDNFSADFLNLVKRRS